LKYREPGIGLTHYANASADFFVKENLKGPVFNDFDIGSYLIFNLFPEERFFIDSRAEAFPASFFSEVYLPMLSSEEKWQKMQEKYQFNTIFFYHYDSTPGCREFIWRRMRDPGWVLVYADIYSVIFLKNNPDNLEKINAFRITKENIGGKLNYLLASENPDDHVAAADLFNLIGRPDLAMPAF